MPGQLSEWPNWPEFSFVNAEKGDDLLDYKRAIIDKYGQEALTQSWLKTCKELETLTQDICKAGTSYIPEIDYEKLLTISPEEKQKLMDVGCFKIKGVVPRKQAEGWFRDLKEYVGKNRAAIKGWPEETPFILNIYFTSETLNSWWHGTNASTSAPLSYADGVRIRPPGVPFYGLGPHIDAGSLARWTDPVYQSVYSAVFSGHPERLDNYDLSLRQNADQAAFQGTAHSTVFRSFQGWTAFSPAAPGEGSLMLYPNVKWSIAYVLLRPFFKQPTHPADILDATKWAFDVGTPWFPGTWKDDSQMLSPSSHPHLRLKECMISIPAMEPGDTIWWHADMAHAVEVEHNGVNEACVAYIGATPSTEQNKKYVKQQLEDFLEGIPPKDFQHNNCTSERKLEGFVGEKGILSEEGRWAMGFGLA
ncbi:hypothetical protein PRZ48_000231 [Zasmidium cellare]|uniref:DUF1479-domain-containing protein n=1 Tax=Zasmidium cellare TaxID=395010 RepID=A0ABR0EXW5_ZASCE|nr:hypothetical protein PRZ48_000231 [Zasmidium cellare]